MDVKEILEQIELRLKCGWPNPMVRQTTEETSAILAHIRELEARAKRAEAKVSIAKQALEIIAGKSQCIDNLMGNGDVAESALKAMEATDE